MALPWFRLRIEKCGSSQIQNHLALVESEFRSPDHPDLKPGGLTTRLGETPRRSYDSSGPFHGGLLRDEEQLPTRTHFSQ